MSNIQLHGGGTIFVAVDVFGWTTSDERPKDVARLVRDLLPAPRGG